MSFEFASQNVLKIIEDHKMTCHEVPSPDRQRSEKRRLIINPQLPLFVNLVNWQLHMTVLNRKLLERCFKFKNHSK